MSERKVVSYVDGPNAVSAALLGILRLLGHELVRYEEPGEVVETSHGREYYRGGRVTYVVEKVKP